MQEGTRATIAAASYAFSRRGLYEAASGPLPPGLAVAWDKQGLRLVAGEREASELVAVEWDQVSSVWAAVRVQQGRGFQLQVALEVKDSEVDFLRFTAPMGGAGGELLAFLQSTKADRLKEERAPGWAMSRWATPLYRGGVVSSNRLRVACGWTATVFDVLFAVCFFTQLEAIFLSREGRFLESLGKLSESVGELLAQLLELDLWALLSATTVGLPWLTARALWRLTRHSSSGLLLLLLLQHLMAFFYTCRSLWSTVTAACRSFQALGRAAGKTKKSLKKMSAKGDSPAAAAAAAVAEAAAADSAGAAFDGAVSAAKGTVSEEGVLRQRRTAQ